MFDSGFDCQSNFVAVPQQWSGCLRSMCSLRSLANFPLRPCALQNLLRIAYDETARRRPRDAGSVGGSAEPNITGDSRRARPSVKVSAIYFR